MRSFGLARISRAVPLVAAFVPALVPALLHAQAAKKSAAVNAYGNPATVTPAPTTAAISIRDLQIRLYQFADDSMMGRQVGRLGNKKGTDYIAAEVKRLGLLPAGDNGTYFQVLPFHLRKFTEHSRLTVDGNPIAWNVDVVAVPGQRAPKPVGTVEVIFGGTQGDVATQITAEQAAGKFVVLLPSTTTATTAGGRGAGAGGQAFAMAGMSQADIGHFEGYDAGSIHLINQIEGYGFARQGEGVAFCQAGEMDLTGRLPSNTEGGNLSGSYMHGWSQVAETVRQLRGEAGTRQVAGLQYAMTSLAQTDQAHPILYARGEK